MVYPKDILRRSFTKAVIFCASNSCIYGYSFRNSKLRYTAHVSTLGTVESNIIVILVAGFYKETRVCVLAANIIFYKVSYIELIVPVIW